ncbi:MAG: glycosyltransferase family 2 protein [Chloroflexaceae bacterium]|nr:glycosyltransferase family 2 protein [Chloroflexaceae bacterium]
MSPKYSIIVPIYNEAETLPELYRRLCRESDRLEESVEIIFVDDGSQDGSRTLIRQFFQEDFRVCYLCFARNFGHQIAVTAGLNFARGEAIVILDGDLQDPPELISQLVAQWQAGYQVVYAQRLLRRQESRFKRWSAFIFYRLLRYLASVDIPADTGDFCLLDRQVVEILNAMPERNRYLRGLRAWVGFRQTAVTFSRDRRYAGKAKYTLSKSLALAVNSIVSFSKVPLRLATYLGLLSGLLSMVMAVLVLYWRLVEPNSRLTGLATILVALFFLGAVQLVSIGILGEYIGRIYEEVKGRPLYTLADLGGFEFSLDSHRDRQFF